MFQFLAGLLAFFFQLVPSYAIAIILLTLTVMLVLFPLTAKSARSMASMQRLQPELRRLQSQHKNDKQKLNEEMMALYKEHKVNPVAGCLPVLLQMPVFLVLYNVISGLTKTVDGRPAPKYLDESTELYQALVRDGGSMNSFGIDLARATTDPHPSLLAAIPFVILILAMVAAQYYQQRQINARNPQAQMNPQMMMVQRVMPGFFGVISLSIPAGVVLYWLVSNLFRIAQQGAMYRFDPVLAASKANAVARAQTDVVDTRARPKDEPDGGGRAGSRTPRNGSGSGGAGSRNGSGSRSVSGARGAGVRGAGGTKAGGTAAKGATNGRANGARSIRSAAESERRRSAGKSGDGKGRSSGQGSSSQRGSGQSGAQAQSDGSGQRGQQRRIRGGR